MNVQRGWGYPCVGAAGTRFFRSARHLALGTTIKTAGSQQAFRAVDFDANLAVARAARAAGARRCGLVSAMAASSTSKVFYNRVKGELEDAVSGLSFEGLVIVRPSVLVGDRHSLGQPQRPLEAAFTFASNILGPLIPANYRPVDADRVAGILTERTPAANGRTIFLSGVMQP